MDAERFKANVNPLPGIDCLQFTNVQVDYNLDVDDQFFNVTCHVDEAMKTKIAKGKCIDLEKLPRKIRYGSWGNSVNDNKLELIYGDGQSFFMPSTASEAQITGIRKWEQYTV